MFEHPVFVIGVIILVILTFIPDQENNTLTQSNEQRQIVQNKQQFPSSNTNTAQEMFDQANNLYNQGSYADAMPLYQNLSRYSGAKLALGEMYENGKGVTKDYSQAIYWYYTAEKIGDENQKDAKAALNKLANKDKTALSALIKLIYKEKNQIPSQAQPELKVVPQKTVTQSRQSYSDHSLTLLNKELVGLQNLYQLAMKDGRRRDMEDLSSQIEDLKAKMSKISETPSKIVNTLEINDGRYGQGTIKWADDRK